MSFKKFLMLGAAGIASVAMTSAMAGGPDIMPPEPEVAGIYFDLNLGYARVNWEDFALPGLTFDDKGKGGFTGGLDIGYQWNEYMGMELGWYHLPKVKGLDDGGHYNLKSWFAYLAAKLIVPSNLFENFDVFFKAGLAYRHLRASDSTLGSAHVVRPWFAVGWQYYFDPSWSLNLQYSYLAEGSRLHFAHGVSQKVPSPMAHLITLGIGYKILM